MAVELKYYPILEIWQMHEEGKIDKYDLLDLTLYNCTLFAQLTLNVPYELSENQILILETWADPKDDFRQLLLCCGRKSAKTDIIAIIILWEVYKLLHKKPTPQKYYHTNKKIYALAIATNREQAQDVTYAAIDMLVEESPWFKRYIVKKTREYIKLVHNVYIKTQSSSSTAGRGYACIVVGYDELAHFLDSTGRRSGDEVYYALEPNLDILVDPTTRNPVGRSLAISTPAGRHGMFWELFKAGKPISVIEKTSEHGTESWRAVFQIPTWNMNPNLPYDHKKMVQERTHNPDKFKQERGAEFVDVVGAAFPRDLVYECAGGTRKKGYRQIGEHVEDKQTRRVITLDPALTGCAYGLMMGHKEKNGIIIVDIAQQWKARSKDEPIDIGEVEDRVIEFNGRFKITDVAVDQYESASTIRNLRKKGINIFKVPPKGIGAQQFNKTAYEATTRRINTVTIKYPYYPPLLDELTFLQRKVSGHNFRWEAAQGYDDDLADCLARLVIILETRAPRTPHVGVS